MLSFLAILPRSLVTFLYAAAALLRFYGDAETIPFERYGFTYSVLDWSLVAFIAATVALVVNLGLEWNSGNRSRNREAEERDRADEERSTAAAERGRTEAERRRAARRARIQAQFLVALGQHQRRNTLETQQRLDAAIALLEEYRDVF